MSDYNKLKDIFEMAEILELDEENLLEISVPCESEQKVIQVQFRFNTEKELIEVGAE